MRRNSPQRPDDDALAWLIDPLSRPEFQSRYYEQRRCLVHRSTPTYYRDLLDSQDLDRVLSSHGMRHPEINLVRGDDDLDRRSYSDASGRIDPVAVVKRFEEGATIIWTQLQRRVPALARLCGSLGQVFGSRIQTNIYLTPPGAQGFKPHWDTHDVFVLQVTGSKLWSLYDTKVELPLTGQRFDSALHHAGAVTEQFELAAGSVVYLPRGLMHSARSTAEGSLHITLGITAFTWTDFLIESVAAVALQDKRLRANLPLGFADGSLPADERARQYREKLSVLQLGLDPEPVWRHFQDEVLATNTPVFTNLLESQLRSDPLTLDSVVSRRTDLVVELGGAAESCVVRFGGTEMSVPKGLGSAMEMVTTATTFRVRDLPDCLDAAGKVTLVSRLLREGLLFRDPPRPEDRT